MTTQPTCQERIDGELRSTLKTLRTLWEAYTKGEDGVPDLGAFEEYHLSFDYVAPHTFKDQPRGYFRYQLSWGGPSEEFRYYTDENLNPVRIEYWFLDWYDGAHVVLHDADKRLLLDIWEWFKEGGAVEAEFQKAHDHE